MRWVTILRNQSFGKPMLRVEISKFLDFPKSPFSVRFSSYPLFTLFGGFASFLTCKMAPVVFSSAQLKHLEHYLCIHNWCLGKAVEIVKKRNTKLLDISPPRFVHKQRNTKRYFSFLCKCKSEQLDRSGDGQSLLYFLYGTLVPEGHCLDSYWWEVFFTPQEIGQKDVEKYEYQLQLLSFCKGFCSIFIQIKEGKYRDKRNLLLVCFLQVKYMAYLFFTLWSTKRGRASQRKKKVPPDYMILFSRLFNSLTQQNIFHHTSHPKYILQPSSPEKD